MSGDERNRQARRFMPRVVSQAITDTLSACFRYRVLGLAAEMAFFTLLSIPPLLFALASSIGFVAARIEPDLIGEFRAQTLQFASQALTPSAVDSVIQPTLDEVFAGGRADLLSIGFLISLWSGSRALYVFIDTVSIMYGHGGHRGVLVTLVLPIVLYLILLLIAVILIPLVLAGPDVVERLLPVQLDWLNRLYWPIMLCGSAGFLAVLYYVSIPRGYRLRSALPGAVLALVIWVGGSWALRSALSLSTGSSTIYGPLAAPIALLVWIYVISIAVLVGAALNAALTNVRRRGDGESDTDTSTTTPE